MLTPERWRRAKDLLQAALARPAEDRDRFLSQACGDDETLRQEVDSLLGFENETRDFIEEPAFSVHGPDPGIGRRIGPYKTVRLLGRGGMGAVYLAIREHDYEKPVALKLIKRGMDTEEIVRRFHNERQILAKLEHPHIARLLDGGTTDDGLPYFVMEYVEGKPIDEYCDAHKLSTWERLKLFRAICSAVQLSHQKLVVHRDLKPGNILVTEDGVPKLLDFGIAKLLRPELSSLVTVTTLDSRPMTFNYASPEQVRGELVTTASDTYSLGVLLYRLLTGHAPYCLEGQGQQAIIRTICDSNPTKPSHMIQRRQSGTKGGQAPLSPESVSATRDGDPIKLRRRLSGDLDSIVLKALSKEPERRYGSVEQFSEDVRRHLEGLPVGARAATLAYRAGKFTSRNKLAIGVVLMIVALSITTTLQWYRATYERDQALRAQSEAESSQRQAERLQQQAERVSAFLEGLFRAPDPDQAQGKTVTVFELLERGRDRILKELKDEPAVQAEQLAIMAGSYFGLGLYDETKELREEVLGILRRLHPEGHVDLAEAINEEAVVHFQTGDYKAAEVLWLEALEMGRTLGVPAEDTATLMNNLAAIWLYRGEYEKAERFYRDALEIRKTLTEPDDSVVASSLYNLGILSYTRGDLDQADELLRKALEIRLETLGPVHTKVATTVNSQGRVLYAKGEYEAAGERFRKALAVRRQLLPEEHIDIAYTVGDLAMLRLAQGDPLPAEESLRQVVETLRQTRPEDDWRTANLESHRGACLVRMERYQEAEPILVATYSIIREARSDRSIYAKDALRRIVDLYESWQRPQEAARYRAMLEGSR